MSEALVREVVDAMEALFPPALASDWDAVGLTVGDPDAVVHRVLFAIDPVWSVADEATALEADLLITHHPLFLRPVHSVAATSSKGRLVHRLVREGIALFSAHTNADHAAPGVSDALADLLGVGDCRPLVPLAGALPGVGTGRVGTLAEAVTLEQFAEHVATVLPPTAHGVRVAGDPQRTVRTIALCGGAGDAFLADAAQVADVYVTADLRHHRAQDHLADSDCALIDVAHWASEWPWLDAAAGALRSALAERGTSVEVLVSAQPTDPWATHRGSAS